MKGSRTNHELRAIGNTKPPPQLLAHRSGAGAVPKVSATWMEIPSSPSPLRFSLLGSWQAMESWYCRIVYILGFPLVYGRSLGTLGDL